MLHRVKQAAQSPYCFGLIDAHNSFTFCKININPFQRLGEPGAQPARHICLYLRSLVEQNNGGDV
ncbi:hypothetical protein Acife_0781 [Acidithiobacillus ferrivorans SS3]|uniref:Uncharacterized protein n=1 Tax=Acidithiobacillus ferrivorans SS3 TaxID=743299 RepID=G0JM25_9PROT|nr:hypothetical protein Acife_0781 [Acidithiobacillus ferrivorans SS3]